MPKSQLGFDVENNYEPKYITIRGKGDILAALRKSVKKSDKSISCNGPWPRRRSNLLAFIKGTETGRKRYPQDYLQWNYENSCKRISWNIRVRSIWIWWMHSRQDVCWTVWLDTGLVRFCRRKSNGGLEVQAVYQSVTLRIIADREEEIAAFIPEEYWTLDADFTIPGGENRWLPDFTVRKRKDNDSFKEELDTITKKAGRCKVPGGGSEKRRTYQKAPVPFTTSTLQQEASRCWISPQKTMRVAQQLYEGVDVKGQRDCWYHHLSAYGFHAYFRWSRCISEAYVEENYGKNTFLQRSAGEKKTVKRSRMLMAEAIRPTDIHEDTVCFKRIAHKRSVPSVSADLETICCKPYGKCTVYYNFR